MFKEAWHMTEDTLPDEAREWVRTSFSNAIMTVKEVQEKWGLSQSTVSRLYTKHDWPFAFKKGNQILFITEFAVPWFEAYNAQQDVNRSKAKIKEDKPKKAKKVKGEYTYTLNNIEYTDTRPPAEVEREWKRKVAQCYPHVFLDLEKPMALPDAMVHPEQYPDYQNFVSPAFLHIGEVFRKLLAGSYYDSFICARTVQRYSSSR